MEPARRDQALVESHWRFWFCGCRLVHVRWSARVTTRRHDTADGVWMQLYRFVASEELASVVADAILELGRWANVASWRWYSQAARSGIEAHGAIRVWSSLTQQISYTAPDMDVACGHQRRRLKATGHKPKHGQREQWCAKRVPGPCPCEIARCRESECLDQSMVKDRHHGKHNSILILMARITTNDLGAFLRRRRMPCLSIQA